MYVSACVYLATIVCSLTARLQSRASAVVLRGQLEQDIICIYIYIHIHICINVYVIYINIYRYIYHISKEIAHLVCKSTVSRVIPVTRFGSLAILHFGCDWPVPDCVAGPGHISRFR